MRKLFIFLFLSLPIFADPYYLFISKEDKGEVISIVEATKQYNPTAGELSRYIVVEADMKPEEAKKYTETEPDGTKKIKLKYSKIKNKLQKEKLDKKELDDAIIAYSTPVE